MPTNTPQLISPDFPHEAATSPPRFRTFARRRKVTEVGAVHADNAHAVLTHLGIRDALAAGELPCHQCKTLLTAETLAAARIIDGSVAVCCNNPRCLEEFNGG